MKFMIYLLVLQKIFYRATADGTITETHVDPIGTYLHSNTKLLTRVEKTVDVRYTYALMRSPS